MNFLFWKTPKLGILPPLINLRKESWLLMECVYFLYLTGWSLWPQTLAQLQWNLEQRTLWDQYKFKWFVPCIEVVLFKWFQSHYIDREGDKFGDLVVSIVERYIIQCPFLGGSSLRGSTVNVLFEDPLMLVQGRRKHWWYGKSIKTYQLGDKLESIVNLTNI